MAKALMEGLLGIIPLFLIFPIITQFLEQWSKQLVPKVIYYNSTNSDLETNNLSLRLTNLPAYRCLVTVRAQITNTSGASQTIRVYLGINAQANYSFDQENSIFNSAIAIRNVTILKWESICETILPNDTPSKLWEGKYLICEIAGQAMKIPNLEIFMIPI